ncbi:MAG: alpha/beta hydrolase, partial [Steroidobacteraceae bacterium]
MIRWIRNGVLGLVGLVIALGVIGALYQFIGNAVDQHRDPPLGELVDVGGYRLHLYCTGVGSPTVVLGSMSPGWSLYWSTVQPEIAKLTRVCSYD